MGISSAKARKKSLLNSNLKIYTLAIRKKYYYRFYWDKVLGPHFHFATLDLGKILEQFNSAI